MNKKYKFKAIKIILILGFISSIYQCSSNKNPVTDEKVLIETNPIKRSEEYIKKGGGILDFSTDKKNTTTYDFATSNALWRATLKSLDFMPLANADYSGGIIIYDWYSEDLNSKEQIKITVRFLSNELRSDSLQVVAHKKICNEDNLKCKTIKLSDQIPSEIKDKILSNARTIKIEEEKNKKKIN